MVDLEAHRLAGVGLLEGRSGGDRLERMARCCVGSGARLDGRLMATVELHAVVGPGASGGGVAA